MIKAKYTVVLKALMDNPEAKAKLDLALSKYPLYEPPKAYDMVPGRQEINKRLLNHYKYREIGFETVGRFLDELEITMDEIMPYYNEMLKTVVTMADLPNPFDNVDFIETFEQERSDTTTSEGNTTQNATANGTATTHQTGTTEDSKTGSTKDQGTSNTNTEGTENGTTTNTQTTNGKNVDVDTPQGVLSIDTENINNVDKASMAKWNQEKQKASGSNNTSTTGSTETETTNNQTTSETSTGSTEGNTESETSTTTNEAGTSNLNTESSGITKHTFKKVGNQGVNTYAHDMNEFRTSIIDVIDQMINDTRIQELFMLVY